MNSDKTIEEINHIAYKVLVSYRNRKFGLDSSFRSVSKLYKACLDKFIIVKPNDYAKNNLMNSKDNQAGVMYLDLRVIYDCWGKLRYPNSTINAVKKNFKQNSRNL